MIVHVNVTYSTVILAGVSPLCICRRDVHNVSNGTQLMTHRCSSLNDEAMLCQNANFPFLIFLLNN